MIATRHLTCKGSLGSRWVGKSVEWREEGTAPQTPDCRSICRYPHQWSYQRIRSLICAYGHFRGQRDLAFRSFNLSPSDLPCVPIKSWTVIVRVLSLCVHWFAWMAVCFSVKCAVTQYRVGVVIVGYNTVWLMCVFISYFQCLVSLQLCHDIVFVKLNWLLISGLKCKHGLSLSPAVSHIWPV